MKRTEASGRGILWFAAILAAAAVVVVAALGYAYEQQARQTFVARERAEVRDALSLLRSDLRGRLDANVQLIQGLVAVLGAAPDIDQAAFNALASQLVDGRAEIRAIALAPDLVIDRIHPFAGNQDAIGLDYRRNPEQLASIMLARDLRATVVAGPIALVQGGRGFVVRAPVFRADGTGAASNFWGVVSAIIDPDRLYAASGLADPGQSLDLAVRWREGKPGVGAAPFYGDAAVFGGDPVSVTVPLPHGAWVMAATPRGGWTEPPSFWVARALFAIAALAVAAPILAMTGLLVWRQARIAQMRAREAELSRLSWRLEFALAASEVGVWDVDLATNELIWDERAKELFGQAGRAGPFTDADWTAALHPDDRARAVEQAETAVHGDGKFATAYRVVTPGGDVRHIRDVAARFDGEDGSRRLVGLVWDVTADVERQTELNLRRLEAEAATVAKSRFLAAMSHEIRTPMGGVLGLLELMLADPLAPRQRERGRIAVASARGLLALLNDILDFSKIEAAKMELTAEPVDLRELAAEVVALMAAGAAQKGLRLSWEAGEAVPPRVVVDPMRLRQVLTNLLSNATKFTEAGEVAVRLDYAEGVDGAGTLTVAVSDTGIGIAKDARARIFGHFEQADNSLTRGAGGSGLGLAISKGLVELMGGRIEVETRPGAGSVFRFTVRARAAAPAPAVAGLEARASPSAPPAEPAAAPLRVLLAEDNPTNQYLVNAFLAQMGHAVVTVGTGTAALDAAQAGGFDVVLMDVQMPEMDGLAAARAIRRLPGPAGSVPIIALTANAMLGDREDCLAHGMTHYLSKPLDVAALRDALARVRPDPAAPPAAPEAATGDSDARRAVG